MYFKKWKQPIIRSRERINFEIIRRSETFNSKASDD
jgi:hypothetical protein